jgi:phage head maturation protease
MRVTRKASKFDTEVVVKSAPVALRRAPDETGVFVAYAATWHGPDRAGETIQKGAFAKSLRNHTPRLLWQHDRTRPIGRLLSAREDDVGSLRQLEGGRRRLDERGLSHAPPPRRLAHGP